MAAIGFGMAIALVPASPAWACSCGPPDPATQVTVEIADSAVRDAPTPFGGGGTTVDLRGAATTVIGPTPVLLDGLDLEEVPVLASVLAEPDVGNQCDIPIRPDAGSDLEVSGIVADEGGETIIYTGACTGELIVLAAPTPLPRERSSAVPVAIGVAALLVVGLIAGGASWQSHSDR